MTSINEIIKNPNNKSCFQIACIWTDVVLKGFYCVFFMLLSLFSFELLDNIVKAKIITSPQCPNNDVIGCFIDTIVDILYKILNTIYHYKSVSLIIIGYYLIIYFLFYKDIKQEILLKENGKSKIIDKIASCVVNEKCIALIFSFLIPLIFIVWKFNDYETLQYIANVAGNNERLFVVLVFLFVIFSLFTNYSRLFKFYNSLKRAIK